MLLYEWQPIETAPKDATDILTSGGYGMNVVGWYATDMSGGFDWVLATDAGSGIMIVRQITHWMPLPDAPPESLSPEQLGAACQRIESRVEFEANTGCWLWPLGEWGGYGQIKFERRTWKVHRLMLERKVGPLEPGMGALHRCDTPACCNPEHLFAGTQSANMQDAHDKGRGPKKWGTLDRCMYLSDEQVIAIRKLRVTGMSYAKIGKVHGIAGNSAWHLAVGDWRPNVQMPPYD